VREAGTPVLAQEFVEARQAELILALGHAAHPPGLLFLGRKYDGHPYRPDEWKILAEVASDAGMALQTLRLHELEEENRRIKGGAS
jgi:GAF domain-containing protein